jgi:predicted 3-demethylubiquinone-9 3-methyltransferase (glyoxalase superfamily)
VTTANEEGGEVQKKITTFLTYENRAEEAVEFYTGIFPRSRITGTTRYGDANPGVSWQVVPRVLGEMLSDPDAERSQRVMAAMMKMGKIEMDGLRRAYEGG